MKPDGNAFLDWLHRRREKQESERQAQGVGEVEWLRRVSSRADKVLESLPKSDSAPVARDRKPGS